MGSNARTGSTPVPSTKEKLYGFSFFVCSVREVCFADYAMVIYSFHKRACTLYIPLAGYALLSYFALRIAVLTYRRLREQDYVYCSTIVCAYMRSRYCFAVRPRFRVLAEDSYQRVLFFCNTGNISSSYRQLNYHTHYYSPPHL